MKTLVIVTLLLGAFAVTSLHRARAQGSDGSAVVMLDAGAGSAAAAPAPPPSSQLHDPTIDPLGALGDLRSYKARWPLLVLAVLIGLTKVLAFAGGKFAFIGRFLVKGKNAMIVSGVGTLAAIALDSLTSGGTWPTAILAVFAAGLALTSSHAPASAVEKHA